MKANRIIEIARRMCAIHRDPELVAVRNELRVALAEYDQRMPTREKPVRSAIPGEVFFVCKKCTHPDLCCSNRLCGETFAT